MKLQWIALLAGVLLSAPLAAQNTVQTAPQEVRTPLYYLERQLKVWKLDRIEPLSQTIPSPFAKGAWRASLTRPFDTAPVEGMPDPLGKRKMKNLAEFILIPKKAGNSADRVRPRLLWKNNVNEVYSPIAFLGEDRGYLWFGKADILTLHWTRKTLGLTRGENLAELFADALNREDENNFTRRSASIILQDYGDAAIPPIRRAIGLALADHEPIRLHLQAFKNIGTPLAAKELVRSLQSGNAEAYAALTDVLAVPPFLKEAREAYFVMAGRHDIRPGAIEAAIQYKWEKDFLQVLRKIVRRPLSFREYMVVRTTIDQFETGKKESPELAAMEQIKILLKAANGCVADIEISSACALPGNLYEVWGDRGALTVPNEGKVLRLKYLKPGFQLPEIHAEEGNYPLFYGNQEHLELISEEIPVEAGRGHTLQKGARKESGVGTQATGYYSQDTMWLDVYDAIRNGYYGPHNPHPGVLPEAFDNLTDKEIQDGAIYLPIPETAFNNNDLMLQNIYWQSKMR